MKNISKLFVFGVCAILLSATSALAFGDIRYPDRPLNLRKARSASAAWVGSLYPGQKVRIAFLKDGWVAVFEPHETNNSESAAVGFSNAKYLKPTQSRVEVKPWGELVAATRNLNVRSKPSTKGNKITMLEIGEQVRVDFPDDDWTLVFSPRATIRSKLNAIGFSSTKFFEPVAGKSVEPIQPVSVASEPVEVPSGQGQAKGAVVPPPAPEAMNAPGSWGTVLTVPGKVNMRRKRTTSSRYVRTLKPGERVRVDFPKNGWYAVFRENEPIRKESRALGYALQSLLDGTPETAGTPAVASTPKVQPTSGGVSTEPVGGVKKTMVINRAKFTKSKRPDPTPDKSVHGYQYRLLEKSETKKYGETWISLKVFLAATKLPGTAALTDFSSTLWKEHKRATKHLAVLIYLPGMDTEDIAYAVFQFSDERMLEHWIRKTTLFGTDFL